MGELDGVVVAGDQPGSHEQLDELFVFGVGGDGAAWDAAANRFAVRCRRDQPQQQVAEQWPLFLGDLVVDRFGRLGDRSPDPAGVLVAVDGEGAALAPLPGLVQRVRQQRQRAGSPSTSRTSRSTRPGSNSRPT